MTDAQAGYIFAQAPNEVERLQSWAHSWEPETETMLDRIQVQPGWRTIDLACGPLGIIDSLSRRVGSTGSVVAADLNPSMLSAARSYAETNGFNNVEFVEASAYQSGLPPASFDLVHARFMLAPLGRDEALLDEMIALARPGGIVASQESDESGVFATHLSLPGSVSSSSRWQPLPAAAGITAPGGALTGCSGRQV